MLYGMVIHLSVTYWFSAHCASHCVYNHYLWYTHTYTYTNIGLTELLMEPGKYPGSSGTRNLHDNLSDIRAQVAANQKVWCCSMSVYIRPKQRLYRVSEDEYLQSPTHRHCNIVLLYIQSKKWGPTRLLMHWLTKVIQLTGFHLNSICCTGKDWCLLLTIVSSCQWRVFH